METYKTLDGVVIDNDIIEVVSMILADCSLERLKMLGLSSKFFDFALTFIGALTYVRLREFISHHITISLMRGGYDIEDIESGN